MEKKLSNELTVILSPQKQAKTASALFLAGTGSRHENQKNNGISHFVEHMLFKGTENRPTAMDITSQLDSVGASFNAFTSKEYTGYWVKAASEHLPLSLDLLSDMIQNSLFSPKEIEKEKGVILEELNMYQDNPMMHIEDVFESCLYGDTPAGWEIIGTKNNIKGFQQKDFLEYWRNQYQPKHSVLCLVGSLPENIINLSEKYFSHFSDGLFREKNSVLEKQNQPTIKINFKKTDQAFLSLGVRSQALDGVDEFSLRLLALILGGSMSSRLFHEIREKRGLAYSIHSQTEFYSDCGYLTTEAGVNLKKTKEAIQLIWQEYMNIAEDINEKELNRAKNTVKGNLAIGLETTDALALWLAKNRLLRGRSWCPEDYLHRMEAVTLADVKNVAKQIFKLKNLNLALIGPFEDQQDFLSLFS